MIAVNLQRVRAWFRPRYRIVTYNDCGFYQVQIKKWYWRWTEASGFRAGRIGYAGPMRLDTARALVRAHMDGTLGATKFVSTVVEEFR